MGDDGLRDAARAELMAAFGVTDADVASAEAIDRFVAARTETARVVAREAWDQAAAELNRKADEA